MSNIAFLKTPAPFNLTGNPITFRIAGKNAFAGNLNKASIGIWITGSTPWPADHYLKFTWGGKVIQFTCKTTPDDSLLEFAPLILLSDLCAVIKKSADLVADYVITYSSGAVTLTAREAGSQYNIIAESDWSAGFRLADPVISSTDHTLADHYRIGLMPEQNGRLIAKMEFPVNIPADFDILPEGFTAIKTGVMQTNISELLHETVNGHFTFPEPVEGFGFNHSLVKDFMIYAYEKYGTNNKAGIYSSTFRYLPGKLSSFRQGELNYLEKSIYDKLTESKMFLTWAPLEKSIDIYAPEKLYFLFITAGTYKLRSKQYYSDGTTAEANRETFTVAAYEIREFFVNYAKIRTNAPKQVVKYDIYITNNAGDIASETRTFIIDYTFRSFARYFFFKNSFGVYELIRTVGKVVKNLNIGKEFINIPLPDDFTEKDKEEKQVFVNSETAYKINSGFLPDKFWADWMQEFLTSDDVYWLKRGKAYPVSIQESKNQVSQDGDYNPFQEFDLTHSIHDDFTEEFSAHEPIVIGDFNIDFNTDFFTGRESTSLIFECDFSDWVNDLPVGCSVNGLPVGWFIANENNSLRVTTANTGQRPFVQVFFADSLGNMLSFPAGSYRVTIDLLEKATWTVVLLKYKNTYTGLNLGTNIIDIVSNELFVIFLEIAGLYGSGSALLDNVKIEQCF